MLSTINDCLHSFSTTAEALPPCVYYSTASPQGQKHNEGLYNVHTEGVLDLAYYYFFGRGGLLERPPPLGLPVVEGHPPALPGPRPFPAPGRRASVFGPPLHLPLLLSTIATWLLKGVHSQGV